MQVNRRLYRCRHDQRIAGVASGLAQYLDLDPSLVRVLWVLSIFLGGVGLLLYIAMAIIVPLEPETGSGTVGASIGTSTDEAPHASLTGWHATATEHRHGSRGRGRAATVFGMILILFGALALLDALLPSWANGGHFLWPAFVLGIGVLLVASAVRREPTDQSGPTEPTES
jgi:phage shock protein PspC (stress-responsive transcriptional regulator)